MLVVVSEVVREDENEAYRVATSRAGFSMV